MISEEFRDTAYLGSILCRWLLDHRKKNCCIVVKEVGYME